MDFDIFVFFAKDFCFCVFFDFCTSKNISWDFSTKGLISFALVYFIRNNVFT